MNPGTGEHRLPDLSDSAESFRIPLCSIDFEPQVRHAFPVTSHEQLTGSIRAVGVLEPILVRPRGDRYGLVFGERRVRAALAAGLTHIPARVQHLSDDQAQRLRLAENLQREALCLLDRVEALWAFKTENRYTWSRVGEELHVSVSYVKTLAGLRNLEPEIKQAVREGLATGLAIALKAAPPEQREELFAAARKGLSVGEARRRLRARHAEGAAAGTEGTTLSTSGAPGADVRAALEALEKVAHLLSRDEREQARGMLRSGGTV